MKQNLNSMAGVLGVLTALSLPSFAAEPTLLLDGATIHTVSGATLPKGQVLIESGRIKAVGVDLGLKADRTVELGGLHLYPGLIAASSTLGLVEIDGVRATRDMTEVGAFTPEVASWLAINPDSELIPVARANGITHTLAVPSGGVVPGRSGLIRLDGWTAEQMLVRGPAALHIDWPSAELDTTPRERLRDRTRFRSLEEQAKERKTRLRELDEFFEEARAYGKASQAGGAGFKDRVPAWEAMQPFLRGERPIVIRADSVREIKAALAWTAERNLAFVLAGGRESWRLAEALAGRKIPVIYEDVFTLPSADDASYAAQFRAPAVLHRAGVKVIFGTSGRFEASSIRNLPYLAAQAVAFGLPEDAAIQGLTLFPAQVLGLSDQLGSIEVGREATLFAADGPILDIRANVKHVWMQGRDVSLETRHTRLYERYKARPKSP